MSEHERHGASLEKSTKDPAVREEAHSTWSREVLSEIRYKAEHGTHRIRGCGTPRPFPGFNDLTVLPSQLTRMAVDTYREPCETRTVLGKRFCTQPLVVETPILISGMSYGALSKEAKIALARSTRMVGNSINNGEGGLLPEERAESYRQVVQVLPSRMGFSLRSIEAADALEIIVGIGAKPGLSGHLMGSKISKEVAEFRQIPEGIDLHSHPRHGDIFGADDLVIKMEQLREVTDNRIPIFIKIAAGRVREDVKIAAKAGADGIVVDGAQGGTGAAPVVAADHMGMPTLPALVQAVRALEEMGVKDEVSLIVSGGIKDGADVAKALALGADAVALGQSVMAAMGCTVCRRCHTGRCAFGIGTQDPELRARLDIDTAAKRVANYIKAMTHEAVILAKASGKTRLRNLEREDLRSLSLEACAMTGVPLVGTDFTFTEPFGFF
ncbi:MAG: FMN-binding glutamate synthase family protein [Desulfovibrionales bacterium]|nr:MAG: FMN-binding glutamate synthase family protein [Desulfovibrionales bacterium]